MKLLAVLCCLLLPTSLSAQSAALGPSTPASMAATKAILNGSTVPASLAAPTAGSLLSTDPAAGIVTDAEVKAYLAAKDKAREQRLADLETDWQQRKAVMEAQMRVLQTAVEYADSAVKAAESAAIASQYVPRPIYPLVPTYPVYPKSSYLCVSRSVMRNTTYVWCQ